MNWFEFIASLVDSLAWPGAVAAGVYFLRRPLTDLIPYLQSLKYKDFEVQFGEKLERLEQELGQEPPREVSPPTDRQRLVDERFESLVEVSPNAATIEAWIDVERALLDLANSHDVDEWRGRPIGHLARYLSSIGAITRRLAGLIDELRKLRNIAVHEGDRQISVIEARRFREVANQVTLQLQASQIEAAGV